jgi:Interferon-induced transmembrane protein
MGYPQQYPPQNQPPQINNNMTMSIVAIFFFWPLAIPAIIAASKVNPALQAGDYATAQQAAADSRKWSKWALIVGISVWVLTLICCGGLAACGALNSSTSTSSY